MTNKIFFFFRLFCSLQKEGKTTHFYPPNTQTQKDTHTKRFYYTRFLWDDDDEFDH